MKIWAQLAQGRYKTGEPENYGGFSGDSVVKNSPASVRDVDSTPGLGTSLEKEMATCTSILAWEISWTEKPDRLESKG